ncbi:hypothetical protein NBRC10512_000002 [Rhodotorula toruloides]|uniref:RHTO0S04e07272g1_1 n=2 Tax=Rhodotorula toruloides TaxID=5286 RepID=A0A061AQ11_RHOTO|nr:uncharacterized protein RHTO_02068 [Rhodotorula toruloides NP11]EMS21197.1 hypothetical protein RHTO_02068 [Rhodotorula toruloides NP11]CDR39632.1 RHTO0S04e07272g1_1 [Rhodotorula toruloides]
MSLAWPTQYAPASFPATQLHASATAPPPPAPSSLPLSSALPPAPPARDLHSARIKFVLDKVRLELDAAREAVKEVCKLQEAVEGVREEVRVLKRGWDERERELKEAFVEAVKETMEEHLAPLRVGLASLADQFNASLSTQKCEFDAALKDASASVVRETEEKVRLVEEEVGKRIQDVRGQIKDEMRAATQKLEEKLTGVVRTAEGDAATVRALEDKVEELEGKLRVAEQEQLAAKQEQLEAAAIEAAKKQPTPPFQRAASSTPVRPPSSASPTRRRRRGLSSAGLIAVQARPTSLPSLSTTQTQPEQPTSSSAPAIALPSAASKPPQSARSTRQRSKRRIIEQDDSLDFEQDVEAIGVASGRTPVADKRVSRSSKRRRVIEQEETPVGSQADSAGSAEQVAYAGEGRDGQTEASGVDEDEEEPDTLE